MVGRACFQDPTTRLFAKFVSVLGCIVDGQPRGRRHVAQSPTSDFSPPVGWRRYTRTEVRTKYRWLDAANFRSGDRFIRRRASPTSLPRDQEGTLLTFLTQNQTIKNKTPTHMCIVQLYYGVCVHYSASDFGAEKLMTSTACCFSLRGGCLAKYRQHSTRKGSALFFCLMNDSTHVEPRRYGPPPRTV